MKKLGLILLACVSVMPSVAMAKLSSDKVQRQALNIEAVISACVFDKNALNDIKSKSVGSSISSGVALAASGTGATLSTMAALKAGKMINGQFDDKPEKKDVSNGNTGGSGSAQTSAESKDNTIDAKKWKEENKKLKTLRLGSTIASGVATGANLATVALSATSVTKIASLMDSVSDCENALSMVEISQ